MMFADSVVIVGESGIIDLNSGVKGLRISKTETTLCHYDYVPILVCETDIGSTFKYLESV